MPEILGSTGSGNGLLPDGTKPSPAPTLTYRQAYPLVSPGINGVYHCHALKLTEPTNSSISPGFRWIVTIRVHFNHVALPFEAIFRKAPQPDTSRIAAAKKTTFTHFTILWIVKSTFFFDFGVCGYICIFVFMMWVHLKRQILRLQITRINPLCSGNVSAFRSNKASMCRWTRSSLVSLMAYQLNQCHCQLGLFEQTEDEFQLIYDNFLPKWIWNISKTPMF